MIRHRFAGGVVHQLQFIGKVHGHWQQAAEENSLQYRVIIRGARSMNKVVALIKSARKKTGA
jgi:hypothetical protein